jgi:hypothetical protein
LAFAPQFGLRSRRKKFVHFVACNVPDLPLVAVLRQGLHVLRRSRKEVFDMNEKCGVARTRVLLLAGCASGNGAPVATRLRSQVVAAARLIELAGQP